MHLRALAQNRTFSVISYGMHYQNCREYLHKINAALLCDFSVSIALYAKQKKNLPNQSKYPRRRLHIEWRSLKCVKRNNNPDRHIQNRVKGNTDARQKRR